VALRPAGRARRRRHRHGAAIHPELARGVGAGVRRRRFAVVRGRGGRARPLPPRGPERGWTAPATLLSLLVGVIAPVGFVSWELRRQSPLLDVRLFRERGLASGSVSLLTVLGVQAGIFVVLFPYFRAVLGWSGLRSTLALMPMALLMMFASGLAPRVARASATVRRWPQGSSWAARGWSSWPPSSPSTAATSRSCPACSP